MDRRALLVHVRADAVEQARQLEAQLRGVMPAAQRGSAMQTPPQGEAVKVIASFDTALRACSG